jgi:hypothetical protein
MVIMKRYGYAIAFNIDVHCRFDQTRIKNCGHLNITKPLMKTIKIVQFTVQNSKMN